MYKISDYNIVCDNSEIFLIYNTKTGAFANIPSQYILDARQILENPNTSSNKELINDFLEGGYIVDGETDELEQIRKLHHAGISNKRLLNITILPAEACNFDCPYCFVLKKRKMVMKNDVYRSIIEFIRKNAVESCDLNISWFGGEPTLAKDAVMGFSERVNRLVSEYAGRVNQNMVTNGFLLDKRSFLDYLDVGIDRFQITLDGFGEQHDKTRYLLNGHGTFEVIWRNLIDIKNLSRDLPFYIVIRHNFLKNGYVNSNTLLEKFTEAFGDDDRFNIYFRPVYDYSQRDNTISSIKNELCSYEEGLFTQEDLAQRYSQLKNGKVDLFETHLPFPKTHWCDAYEDNSFVFGADGRVYKCDSYIDEDTSVGMLRENGEILFNDNISKWKLENYSYYYEKCIKCKMLPICHGGCLRQMVEGSSSCFWNEYMIRELMKKHHFMRKQQNYEPLP